MSDKKPRGMSPNYVKKVFNTARKGKSLKKAKDPSKQTSLMDTKDDDE